MNQDDRAKAADFTLHNNRLESQTTTPETEVLVKEWVNGERTIDSVVEDTRRKYGLV